MFLAPFWIVSVTALETEEIPHMVLFATASWTVSLVVAGARSPLMADPTLHELIFRLGDFTKVARAVLGEDYFTASFAVTTVEVGFFQAGAAA